MVEESAIPLRGVLWLLLVSVVAVPPIGLAQEVDLPPEIAAADTVTGIENALVTFQAKASDPEGDPIVYFYAGSLPLGASFVTDSTNTTGVFSWNPSYFHGANYEILLSAASARRPTEVSGVAGPPLTANKTVYLRILNQNRPPVLVHVPDHVIGAEEIPFGFEAEGSDPDGDPVVVTMTDLPPGATVRSIGMIAQFSWRPRVGQGGEHSVTVTAQSTGLQTSQNVPITVVPDQPPVLEGPAEVFGKENELLTFQVHASDPDGDVVTLSAGFLPGNATFIAEPGTGIGTFTWIPGFHSQGRSTVQLSARSAVRADPVSGPILGFREATLVTQVTVANTDRPPVIPPLLEQVVDEGTTLRKEFYVTDPDWDWDLPQLTLVGPEFARLEQEQVFLGMVRGSLVLEPGYRDAGVYTENRIDVLSGSGSATASFTILVRDRNAPPDVTGPERVSGDEGSALAFVISATDPDAEALALEMTDGPAASSFVDHGDNSGGFSWTPGYDQAGEYVVRFGARDTHGLSSEPVDVPIHVADVVLEAHAFLELADQVIRLESGKPTVCVQIEPLRNSYENDAVALGSIVMRSSGTGSVTEIAAVRSKTAVGGDRNRNGIVEITACFMKEDLRLLFGGLYEGRQEVPVSIEGSLLPGGTWRANLDVTFVGLRNAIHLAVTPNPARPGATLMVRTSEAGPLTVRLYDIQGRLVRTLAQGEYRDAGAHALSLDGDYQRARLRSGVYFYKVIGVEGERSGRLVVGQ